ncbi:MAG: hypothetical protein LBW85_07140 [Deltaproteobacteria bacterium]|jgi:hypothetical protein|nr:hypothetical protein [Deltaproteobacteria bacterium]
MNLIPTRLYDTMEAYQGAVTARQASVAVTDGAPNVVAQIMEAGAPKPHATVTNTMVAMVDRFTPPPGRNMRQYLALEVDKAGRSSTTVVDALQRYFNVRPRREPFADPKDIASTDSFPTLIMDEAAAYARNFPYQFSVNGIPVRQQTPDFYSRGGALKIRILGPGVSTVETPETSGEPGLKVGPFAEGTNYYPPAYAAQLAMQDIQERLHPDNRMETYTVGPPASLDDPGSALARVMNSLQPVRAALFGPLEPGAATAPAYAAGSRAGSYSGATGYAGAPLLQLQAMQETMA